MRVQIFVDFWNLQLGWNELVGRTTPPIKIPWKDILPQVLVAEVSKGSTSEYAGTNVYASIDPQSAKDKGLKNFLRIMDGFPGYSVSVAERKPRKPHSCSNDGCRKPINDCPHCHLPLRRTVEKGVDASLITDLLSMAFDDNYDIAILVTEDADFAPAVRYIQKKTGKKVIQAYFKRHGDELRNACWDHIFLDDLMVKLIPAAPVATETNVALE
jgi:uncharacterized LabA/DUF88 family protein